MLYLVTVKINTHKIYFVREACVTLILSGWDMAQKIGNLCSRDLLTAFCNKNKY